MIYLENGVSFECLYSSEQPFMTEKLVDPELYSHLKRVKSKIDDQKDRGWEKYVKLLNNYEKVPLADSSRKINRAFYKFCEIIVKEPSLVSAEKVGFVCEAPGGFIQAMQFAKKECVCIAQSLRTSSCCFSRFTENKNTTFLYGPDESGNLYNTDVIRDFVEQTQPLDFIAADGGFDVSHDYNGQEVLSTKLIWCEVVTALGCLKKGGNFVCKLFDMFTLPMAQIIFIIKSFFEEITLFKPLISRPCNAERYIIAKRFKGITPKNWELLLSSISNWDDHKFLKTMNCTLPEDFTKQLKQFNNGFIAKQMNSINAVHKEIKNKNRDSRDWENRCKRKQWKLAHCYLIDLWGSIRTLSD